MKFFSEYVERRRGRQDFIKDTAGQKKPPTGEETRRYFQATAHLDGAREEHDRLSLDFQDAKDALRRVMTDDYIIRQGERFGMEPDDFKRRANNLYQNYLYSINPKAYDKVYPNVFTRVEGSADPREPVVLTEAEEEWFIDLVRAVREESLSEEE